MTGLAQRAATGITWMFLGSAGQHAISLLVSIILARLLSPGDFGAVALVMAVVEILQTFAEMGISVALVQKKEVSISIKNSAFAGTVLMTLSVSFLLWVSASGLADFYKLAVLETLLDIAALSFLFRGMYSFYRCLLLKEMRYREITCIDSVYIIVYGGVAIFLARQNYGVMSIMWGQAAATFSQVVLGLLTTRFLPQGLGKLTEILELLKFGVWVSIGRVLGTMSGKVDTFLIGKLVSSAGLGGYYVAQHITLLFPATYTGITDQVMFPIYSRWQDEPKRVEEGYNKVLGYTSFLVMPPIFLVYLLIDPFVRLCLGAKWLEVVPLVRIMCLFGVAQSLGGGIFGSVINALGRPQVLTLVNLFRIVALPTCIIIGSHWGVTGVAWGFSIYGVVGRLFNQWLLTKFFGFSFRRYFKEIAPAVFAGLGATAPVFVAVSFLKTSTWEFELVKSLGIILFWAAGYLAISLLLVPEEIKYLKDQIITLFLRGS